MKRKSNYSLDYYMPGYTLLEKYSDKYGFRVFILKSQNRNVVFDMVKINYPKKTKTYNWCEEEELFCLKDSNGGYFLDPTCFRKNLDILTGRSARRVRKWVMRRLRRFQYKDTDQSFEEVYNLGRA